jgi:hypothetical protein
MTYENLDVEGYLILMFLLKNLYYRHKSYMWKTF